MNKYYEEIITRVLFKYDDSEERDVHKKEMISSGWRCESIFEVPDRDPFDQSANWTLAAEYIK